MTDKSDVKSSRWPANATFLVIFLIVTLVLIFVVPTLGIFGFAVIIAWSAKLLFDLMRWLRLDKETRPKMRFPKKSVGVLLVVVLTVGYFGYLIVRDMGVR